MCGPLAVVLDEVGLVEDHADPADGMQTFGVLGEQVVVDDYPACVNYRLLIEANDFDRSLGIDKADFASPVQLE